MNRTATIDSGAVSTTTANESHLHTSSCGMDITKPGSGWSNGAIATTNRIKQPEDKVLSLYSHTQSGKKELYSEQRRWIGLEGSGWTRLGASGHETWSHYCGTVYL